MGFEHGISAFRGNCDDHYTTGKLLDTLTGKSVLKNCVRDRKRVFAFLVHAVEYVVIAFMTVTDIVILYFSHYFLRKSIKYF